ncbi:hypothetical protein GQ42DRAFT_181886 [Ramicandelaber brevisporus]|nr:hypothetical protein GQ42DRAFT_181886 [Ramicandelaber brevisporus]
MASHRDRSSSSHTFHSGGRFQNGEEGNVFEGSGGERYRGTHSTALPDARMDTRQASGAAQPDMCIETVLSLLRNSAQREQDDRARMQHKMERERADIAFLQHALERADRLENEKKLLDEENKQLRTEVERLKLEAAESHKKPASVRARGNHRASMNLNMSRTASPFASTTTTPTSMAPTNLFSGMSDRSSSVGGNSIHNVNPDGLERTITPYPEEETTSLDANQNERGTRIGQGTSSDGQTGDNAPGSATPSGSGASQQSGKMRQRLCKELSDMFNDDRSLYKLIHLAMC